MLLVKFMKITSLKGTAYTAFLAQLRMYLSSVIYTTCIHTYVCTYIGDSQNYLRNYSFHSTLILEGLGYFIKQIIIVIA